MTCTLCGFKWQKTVGPDRFITVQHEEVLPMSGDGYGYGKTFIVDAGVFCGWACVAAYVSTKQVSEQGK